MCVSSKTQKIGVSANFGPCFLFSGGAKSYVNNWDAFTHIFEAHAYQLLTQDFCFENVFLKLCLFFKKSHSPCGKNKIKQKKRKEHASQLLTQQRATCFPIIDPTAYIDR